MSDSFAKVFASLLDSSVWFQPHHVRIVWVAMIVVANRRGRVESTVDALACRARVSVSECEEALAYLLAPDPDSRNRANEGRRIKPTDRGWQILNYAYFRDRLGPGERRNEPRAAIPAHVRRAVVARDGMVCWLCDGAIDSAELHLDHVMPWSHGGPDSADNLRPAHGRCNLVRGNRPPQRSN